jgi:hypothetical protein
MDVRHAILFEPVRIGPKTLPRAEFSDWAGHLQSVPPTPLRLAGKALSVSTFSGKYPRNRFLEDSRWNS